MTGRGTGDPLPARIEYDTACPTGGRGQSARRVTDTVRPDEDIDADEGPMRMNAGLKLRVIAAVALLAAACGGGQGGGALTVAVIPKGTSHAFWQSIHAGAEKAAQELGITVVWRGPLREDDRESQVTEVENAVARGVARRGRDVQPRPKFVLGAKPSGGRPVRPVPLCADHARTRSLPGS